MQGKLVWSNDGMGTMFLEIRLETGVVYPKFTCYRIRDGHDAEQKAVTEIRAIARENNIELKEN